VFIDNKYRGLLCKFLFLAFILVNFACKQDTLKKEKTLYHTNLRHVCLTDNEFIRFYRGTTADSEDFLWGIPADFSNGSIYKLFLSKTDDYTLHLNKGQGPGEIRTFIGEIFYTGNVFIVEDGHPYTPLMFFDKELNYLMSVSGIKEFLNDIKFLDNEGKLIVLISPSSYQERKDKELKQMPFLSVYSIYQNTAKQEKVFLSFFDVKNMLKNNGFNMKQLKTDDTIISKFIDKNTILLANHTSPFFLLYNCKSKKVKKVMLRINKINKAKKYKDIYYFNTLGLGISKKYIYFQQPNYGYKGYSIVRYTLSGDYDCSINMINFIKLKKQYSNVGSMQLFVTKNDKIILAETFWLKPQYRTDDCYYIDELAVYDFNKLAETQKTIKE
jgi:hypothetical protein